MKAKDLHNETVEELKSKLETTRKKYLELRFQHSGGRTLPNPIQIRDTRRDIARILTIITEKERKE